MFSHTFHDADKAAKQKTVFRSFNIGFAYPKRPRMHKLNEKPDDFLSRPSHRVNGIFLKIAIRLIKIILILGRITY